VAGVGEQGWGLCRRPFSEPEVAADCRQWPELRGKDVESSEALPEERLQGCRLCGRSLGGRSRWPPLRSFLHWGRLGGILGRICLERNGL
jgi:hypothetical protein